MIAQPQKTKINKAYATKDYIMIIHTFVLNYIAAAVWFLTWYSKNYHHFLK